MDREKPIASNHFAKKWQEKDIRIQLSKVRNSNNLVEPIRVNKSMRVKSIKHLRHDCKK